MLLGTRYFAASYFGAQYFGTTQQATQGGGTSIYGPARRRKSIRPIWDIQRQKELLATSALVKAAAPAAKAEGQQPLSIRIETRPAPALVDWRQLLPPREIPPDIAPRSRRVKLRGRSIVAEPQEEARGALRLPLIARGRLSEEPDAAAATGALRTHALLRVPDAEDLSSARAHIGEPRRARAGIADQPEDYSAAASFNDDEHALTALLLDEDDARVSAEPPTALERAMAALADASRRKFNFEADDALDTRATSVSLEMDDEEAIAALAGG